MFTLKEINTLQCAVDYMADDDATDESITELLIIYNKLAEIKTRLQKHTSHSMEARTFFSVFSISEGE